MAATILSDKNVSAPTIADPLPPLVLPSRRVFAAVNSASLLFISSQDHHPQ